MNTFLLCILLGSSLADHDYFEYEDCGACTKERACCTIAEENPGEFITRCCSSEDCRAQESNLIVCICPDQAPIGGSDLWPDFRRWIHPSTTTPAPEKPDECAKWKVMLGVGWFLSGSSLIFFLVKILLRKLRSRPRFERVIDDDHPYQPTTQSIDNIDNSTSNLE